MAGHVSVANGVVSTPIILGQRYSEIGRSDPFLAAARIPVIDQYPLRLGEPKSGQPGAKRLNVMWFVNLVDEIDDCL